MTEFSTDQNKVAMVIMAHPDDAEITTYGLICKLIDNGYTVINIIACCGENGVSIEEAAQGSPSGNTLSRMRMLESTSAFGSLGVHVQFLNEADGSLTFGVQLITKIENVIQAYTPSLVITHYPDSSGLDHQDHLALGTAVNNACRRRRCVTTLLFAQPHNLGVLFAANCFTDVSKYFEAKMTALAKHKSQGQRYYLTREYHESRGRCAAVAAGFFDSTIEQNFEAFILTKLVF